MKKSLIALLMIFTAFSCSDGGDAPKEEEVVSPEAATLVFPLNNSECIEGVVKSDTKSTVTFDWEDALHANRYELKLKNLSTGLITGHNISKSEVALDLERGVAYSWYVISRSQGSSEKAESPVWKFYNASVASSSYAPFPAEVVAPQINQEVAFASAGIVLEWSGSDVDKDIESYDLYFGESDSPELFKENLTVSKLENVEVKAATNYYWKVKTKDTQGNISYSDLFQFNVK
ncbi:hypothetical protein HCG49_14755 [Arenibacter sp. 6A1]|uniref:hypothetical protein n=1 Tax=Arenibacter sp. 6A1 TaxID=2720391 RepID=UPI0014467F06|nr:hypothetical protein [Arenibacter sp. 6A1]NKI27823.1 hypothetical protein [Arenibacter sp. 6A1]